MRAIIGRGKIELRLNADVHALRRARSQSALRCGEDGGACATFFLVFLVRRNFVERQPDLGIIGIETVAAGAEMRQALGNFTAPIGFESGGVRVRVGIVFDIENGRADAYGLANFVFISQLRRQECRKTSNYRSRRAEERHTSSIFVSLVGFAPRMFQCGTKE